MDVRAHVRGTFGRPEAEQARLGAQHWQPRAPAWLQLYQRHWLRAAWHARSNRQPERPAVVDLHDSSFVSACITPPVHGSMVLSKLSAGCRQP